MNESYNKSDIKLRVALFEEYDGRCFYEGTPIRFKDMHIDHIIPKSIKDREMLETIGKELGLPHDFNVNSLYNLVPCSPNSNLCKNKSVYPIHYLEKLILDTSSKKVGKIKQRIQNLSQNYKDDKQFTKLLARLREYDNKEKLEELYNELANEKPFDIYRKVNKTVDFYKFERSLCNVKLSGNLPFYPNLEGSCLITFSNLRLRDCMITLNHSQIMDTLFEGAKTKLEHKLRKYILHVKEINPDVYYVDLGNTRLPLEKKEVEQLVEIIDDFYEIYMEESRDLYQFFRKDVFNNSNDKNRLRLFQIDRQTWFMILNFCRQFDYDKGDSEWHIFDATGSTIKVYDKSKREFRLFVHAEIEHIDFLISSQERVWVVWTDEFFLSKKLSDFEQNNHWSPEFAYRWLIEEFIPYVFYFNSNTKAKRFGKKLTFDEFKRIYNINNYVFHLSDISQKDNLYNMLNELQIFFSTYKNDIYTKQELINLYECLTIVVLKTDIEQDGLRYICDKLNIKKVDKKEDLLSAINDLAHNINDENIVSGFFVDLIFRGMVVSLRDYPSNLSNEEENLIKEKLYSFSEKYISDQVRRKM